MKHDFNATTGWHEYYGIDFGLCVLDDQPASVGYADACTVIEEDREYAIRVSINLCSKCYSSTPRSKINRLMKKKRLELVENGEHLHSVCQLR